LFVKETLTSPSPIASMPGHVQHTLESLIKEARELTERGVAGLLLFGIPGVKDAEGSGAWADDGITQLALRAVKDEVGDELVVIADLCMCEYTDHGHCGIVEGGEVNNDRTLNSYGRIAVSQAAAGADMVAPSGMMDGQVEAIREALDGSAFDHIPILAYAAKYASSFYGPCVRSSLTSAKARTR
jgi:porphobilinogen synthase